MALTDPQLQTFLSLINDSFRVRLNQTPIYVDVSNNLQRIAAKQHQIIFGRRGSGKSCLLVHFSNSNDLDCARVYVLADEFKRLSYPDVLIRLLIAILEQMPVRGRWVRSILRLPAATTKCARELRRLLDAADEAEVVSADKSIKSRGGHARAAVPIPANESVAAGANINSVRSTERQSSFRERKIETLERHLPEYKKALQQAASNCRGQYAVVLVDDFYLLPRDRQPDVVDYLHRLLRDTDLFLKVATIKHRTSLLRNSPQTIGVELSQDVETLSLDRTLENIDETKDFLWQMLQRMATKADIADLSPYFNPDAFEALTLVSGGVPRDALTILVNAVNISVAAGQSRWLTPTMIYKGAGRLTYQTKIQNIKEDAGGDSDGVERVFADLLKFCLKEVRKTAFLISQDDARRFPREHGYIQQLMDFKLVHVVEPDTSAASGRAGRYEAYTLDFSLFMDPRRRNIEVIEFWKIDEQRRRIGIREAPMYSLERVKHVLDGTVPTTTATEVLSETEEPFLPSDSVLE